MLDIDCSELEGKESYRLMVSAIIPRPVAWVSTLDKNGRRNLAPFSYFMGVGSKPPMLAISIGERKGSPKDTARNIIETGEFVVNLCPRALVEKMVHTAGEFGPEIDEFEAAGLTPVDSVKVKAPGVGESPVRMECKLHEVIQPGANAGKLILGEVLQFRIRDDVVVRGRVDARAVDPIARLGGREYAALGEIFTVERPVD